MRKIKKVLSTVFTIVFTMFTLLCSMPAEAAVKKTVLPDVQFASAPVTEYTAGDRVQFNINSPNYGAKVEYRVILWDDSKKQSIDLWNDKNGYPNRYYTKWQPTGNTIFTLGWPILEPGNYRITVFAKRVGVASSKAALIGMNCDSYKESVAFTVKPKVALFDKEGQTYGSSDANKLEIYKGDTKVTGNNVALSNAKVEGDLYISGNNAVIKNVSATGKIVIDPGKNGSTTLENVTAKKIEVLSGGQNSIHIKSVHAETMNISSSTPIRIETDGDTEIVSTTATGYVIFDRKSGTYGTIIITEGSNGVPVIEFRGDIKDKVIVETNATIKTSESSKISNLAINTSTVKLEGKFGEIQINTEAKVEVAANTKIESIFANTNAEINMGNTAVVDNLGRGNNTVVVSGGGRVGPSATIVTGGNTSSGSYIPPTYATVGVSSIPNKILTAGQATTTTVTTSPYYAAVSAYSSNTAVAAVSVIDHTIYLNAGIGGTTNITVYGSYSGFTTGVTTFTVTVNAGQVAVSAVTVTPITMNLTAGGAPETITAAVSPSNATYKNVIWVSSNSSVATVVNGVVTPLAAGTTTITAISFGDATKTAICTVTVMTTVEATALANAKAAADVELGKVAAAQAAYTTAGGLNTDSVYAEVTAAAAAVNNAKASNVTANILSATGTLTAKLNVLSTATAALPNLAPTFSGATINGTPEVGGILTAAGVGYTDRESDPQGTPIYQWMICDTIDGTYMNIMGATNGTYTTQIIDSFKFIKVKVTPVALTGTAQGTPVISVAFPILVAPGALGYPIFIPMVLQIGEMTIVPVTTAESGAGNWISSNTNVATIDSSGGFITVVGAGTTTIAYTTSASGKVNSKTITVYPAAAITNPTIGTVQVGAGIVTPTGYTAPIAGQSISWISSDTTKAAIDPATGAITPVAAGSTTIRYIVTETVTSRIIAKGSTTITIQPGTQSGSPVFTAGTPATYNTPMTVGAGNLGIRSNLIYTWYRSDNAIYDSGTDTFLVTDMTYTPIAADVGKYLIVVATTPEATGNGTVATTAVAKILGPAAPSSITGTFPAAATTINLANLETNLVAFEAAVAIDGSTYGVYAELIVDASGKATISGLSGVTAFTKVRVRVKETTTTYPGPDKEITVTAAPLGAVITGLSLPANVLQMGETETTTAATVEAGAGNWTSSNTSAATVDAGTGVVTAVGAGTTTITYTTSTSGSVNSTAIQVFTTATEDDPAISEVRVGAGNITPTDFTAAGSGQTIGWTSSDTAKATVDAGTGVITPISAGDTTISYKVTENITGRVVVKGKLAITVQPAKTVTVGALTGGAIQAQMATTGSNYLVQRL